MVFKDAHKRKEDNNNNDIIIIIKKGKGCAFVMRSCPFSCSASGIGWDPHIVSHRGLNNRQLVVIVRGLSAHCDAKQPAL